MKSSTPSRGADWQRTLTSRRTIALGAGGLALAGIAFALHSQESATGRTRIAQAPTAAVTVDLVAPTPARFDQAIVATGNVAAVDELIVGSEAAGYRLTDVLVDVGSRVRKGDLLARADDAQLLAQRAQQDALIKQAQAEFVQALANFERAEALDGSGVYSVEVMQTRRTAVAQASAKIELARAQRRELDVRLANTYIVAPAAGVIARRTATVGAVVQPGAELFRLIRDNRLEWRAELPGHTIARIRKGTRAQVLLDDGRAIDATVRLVAPTIDPATRNGLVHVGLPAGVPLKAGGHAKGRLLVDQAAGLALPASAVLTRDGYPYVYVVGSDQIARRVKIDTGVRQGELIEVSAGLPADARVVTTGAGFVKDGDRVRIAAAPAARANGLAAAPRQPAHSGSPS